MAEAKPIVYLKSVAHRRAAATAALALLACGLGGCTRPPHLVEREGLTMGSTLHLTAWTMDEVKSLTPRLRREPIFAVIKIAPGEVPRFLPPRDGAYLTTRFRSALGIVPT